MSRTTQNSRKMRRLTSCRAVKLSDLVARRVIPSTSTSISIRLSLVSNLTTPRSTRSSRWHLWMGWGSPTIVLVSWTKLVRVSSHSLSSTQARSIRFLTRNRLNSCQRRGFTRNRSKTWHRPWAWKMPYVALLRKTTRSSRWTLNRAWANL